MEGAYVLGVFVPALWVLDYPPEMAGEIDCAALIGFLEEFASMKSGFGDQRVVVLLREPTCAVQSTCNDTDCLELGARVTDCILVDGEGLSEELVADFFETGLIGDFAAHHEQPERQICTAGVDSLVQIVDALVHEAIEGRGLRLPVVIVVLTRLQLPGQADGSSDKGWCSIADSLVAIRVCFPSRLKEL